MKENLLNILANSSKEIDNQQLMEYLRGNLSGTNRNKVEQWLSEQEALGKEAMEGLHQFSSQHAIHAHAHEINQALQKHIRDKKQMRRKNRLPYPLWIYLSLLLVLLLILAAYGVLRLLTSAP